jgi:hypothetical protein
MPESMVKVSGAHWPAVTVTVVLAGRTIAVPVAVAVTV